MRGGRILRAGGTLAAVVAVAGGCASDAPVGPVEAKGDDPCEGVATIALQPGAAATLPAGRNCLPGTAAGAEYVVVAFNGADATATVRLAIPGTGDLQPRADRALVAQPSAAAERRALLLPALAASAPRAVVAASPPAVGARLEFNVQLDRPCDAPVVRAARVVAVSRHAIVAADTGNPAGLDDADYAAIAATFDTLVHPVVTGVFGAPSDVDGNGRVVILYTAAVNALAAPGAASWPGALFAPRDLFPRGAQGCAGSNAGEVIYMLAADEGGAIRGNVRTRDHVRRVAAPTLAHELQHLVNAGRRIAGGHGDALLEEEWLDEGLSHAAEELLFFAATGERPGQRLTLAQLGARASTLDAFYRYQAGNIARVAAWLAAPAAASPLADGASQAQRGATWQLLRFAADRWTAAGRGGEREFWQRLATSRATGRENLRAVLGEDPERVAAEWALAQVAAPAGGATPSWEWSDVVPPFAGGRWPLHPAELDAGPALLALRAGGAGYARAVALAGGATVVEASADAGVTLRVARTR